MFFVYCFVLFCFFFSTNPVGGRENAAHRSRWALVCASVLHHVVCTLFDHFAFSFKCTKVLALLNKLFSFDVVNHGF